MRTLIAIAAMTVAALPSAALAKAPAGVWANPKNNVHVTFRDCGRAMCGRVVWASASAQAKAAEGSGARLLGSDLFRNFIPQGPRTWAGSVLIPDIGQTVTGTIEQVDAKTLVGEGCLVAGFGCQQQVWKRIK